MRYPTSMPRDSDYRSSDARLPESADLQILEKIEVYRVQNTVMGVQLL